MDAAHHLVLLAGVLGLPSIFAGLFSLALARADPVSPTDAAAVAMRLRKRQAFLGLRWVATAT